MRTVRLARVAAQAEILLLRRMLAVVIRHTIFGAVAAAFAISVFVLLHVLSIEALEQLGGWSSLASAAIVLAVDLIVAAVFGILAMGKITDPIAEEARRVRDTSLEEARQSLTLAAILAQATRVVAQTGLVRVVARSLGAGVRRARRQA